MKKKAVLSVISWQMTLLEQELFTLPEHRNSFPVLVAQAPEKKIIWVYQQVIVFKENTSSCSLSIYPAFILVHKDLLFGLQFLSLWAYVREIISEKNVMVGIVW